MSKDDTLYEQVVKRLKNNKAVVVILLIFAIVIGASKFMGGLSGIADVLLPPKNHLEVNVSVQSYDIMAEITESPVSISPVSGGIDNIDSLVDKVSQEIVKEINPERVFETTLTISGSNLKADRSLIALVFHMEPAGARFQMSPHKTEIVEEGGFDIEKYFESQYSFMEDCSCIEMRIKERSGSFKPEGIKIYTGEQGYSFKEDSPVQTKTLNLDPTETRVILEPFNVSGASSEVAQRLRNSFDSKLKSKLQEDSPLINLSGYTKDEILRIRQELRTMRPGASKLDLIYQYKVDFIISGNVVINQQRSFLGF